MTITQEISLLWGKRIFRRTSSDVDESADVATTFLKRFKIGHSCWNFFPRDALHGCVLLIRHMDVYGYVADEVYKE